MNRRWRPNSWAGFGCIALICALLLAGCGRSATGGATPTQTPARAVAGTPGIIASPAVPATGDSPPNIDNARVTPPPWRVSPVVAPALAQTPTPLVCPTLLPPASAANPNAGGSCQQVNHFTALSPTFVAVVAVGGAIEVQWHATGGIATHYAVYRQVAPRGAWARVASVEVVPGREAPGSSERDIPYAWRDTTAASGTTYRYAVNQISLYGFQSSPAKASLLITAP